MDDSLFADDFPFAFTLKPLLFAGKVMEQYGVRADTDAWLLLPRQEFRIFWQQFPEQRLLSPTGHRVLRIEHFEFYEHWFGYDYLVMIREATDRKDYLVISLPMLIFVTSLRVTHETENAQAKHDLAGLMQQLGVWPEFAQVAPRTASSTDLHADDTAHLAEDGEQEKPEQKEPHHD